MSAEFDLASGFIRTLSSTLGAAALALGIASVLGRRAARRDGLYDDGLHRFVELTGALPLLVVIPLLGRVWPLALTTALVLGVHHGLRLAYVCRNQIHRLATQPFVLGARSLGLSARETHRRHVSPVVLPVLMLGVLLVLPTVVSVEAALSYLKLDATPSSGAYLLGAPGPTRALSLGLLGVVLVALHVAGERRISRFLGTSAGTVAAGLAKEREPTKSSTNGTHQGHRTDVRKRDSSQ